MYKAEEKLNLVRGKRTSEESKNDSNILKYLPVPSAQAEKADIKAPVTKRRGTFEGDGLPIREENKRYYVYRSQNARELENAEKDFTNKNRAYTQVSALAKKSISDAENLKKDYESCLKSYNENPTDETYNKYSEAVDKYNSTAELANYYSELTNKAVGMATESQARYLTAYENEKKHFDDWKSRIRNADEIKAEIKDIKDKKGSIEDDILELNMRKSAIIDYPESDERDRNLKIVNDDIELRQKLRDELAEKIALDEDELYNSIYYVYDDLRKNEDFAEKSKYDKTVKDADYTYVNKDPLSQASRFVTGASARDKSTQYMTDDYEVPMYNYIYKTEGKKAAEKYIDFLQADINLRSRTAVEENARAFAKKHPVGSSVTSILITPMKSVGAVMTALDYITKGEFDENSPYLSATHMSGAIRNEVSGKLGSVGGFAYDTAMSIADNLINMAAGGGNSAAVLALMGTEVFADSAVEAKDRGLSDGQVFALALTNAGIEVLTEKIGLDKLCEHLGEGKRAVTKFILENIGSEAGEEAVSGILDPLADIIISGDKSEYNTTVREYMKSGLTKAEAQKKAFWQIAADVGLGALGGAISGGVLGGGKAAIVSGVRTVAKEKAYHDFGKSLGKDELKTAEARKMLIETGLESEKGSEAHKYAEKMQAKYNKNGKISLRSTEKLGVLSEIAQMTETDERIASKNEGAKKETGSFSDSLKNESGNSEKSENANRIPPVSDTIIHENSENSAKKSNRNKNVTIDTAVEPHYSLTGIDEDGIENYTISGETKKLTWSERTKLFAKSLENKQVKFEHNGQTDYATFESVDIRKNVYGDNKSSRIGKKVKINLGAEGDYIDVIGNSIYEKSSAEIAHNTRSGRAADSWDYYYKTVKVDGKAYDVLLNVRKAKDGKYVYNAVFQNKKETGTLNDYKESWSSVRTELPRRESPVSDTIIHENSENSAKKSNRNKNVTKDSVSKSDFSAEKQTRTSTRQTLHADVSRPAESGSTNAYPLDNIISEKERKSTERGNVNKKVTNDSPKTDNAKSESDVRSKAEAERLTKRYTTWTGIVHRYNNAEYERYRSASSITEKSAILANADAKTAELATKYSKAFGVPVVFFNESATESGINDGYYLGGTVFVNSQSKKPFVRLYAHELTHSIENTKSYSELSKYVFSALESKGKSRETLISEKTEEYKKISRGKVTLDSMTAENEIISEYVENNLLTDEEAIKDFLSSVEKPHNVFRAVKNLFNRLLSVIGHGNYKEMKFIEKMKQAYSNALSEMKKENAKVNSAFENAVYDGDFEDAGDNSDVRKEYSVSSDFYGACRDIENGTLDRSENPFVSISSETPQILIDTAGAKNLPVIISYESLYLALRKSGELTGHYHGLGSESLSRITRSMNDPEMILRLANGRVNEIISVENNGKRYLVSVEFDAVKDFEGSKKAYNAYNLVLTIFEPKANYLRNMLAKPENTVIYKKNSNTFSQVNPRLNELSGSINENDLSSGNSISQNSDLSIGKKKNSNTFSQVNPRLNELSGTINENNLSSDNSISQNSDLSIGKKKNSNTFSQVNPRLNELSGIVNENDLSSDNSISQNSDLSTADGKKYSLSSAEKKISVNDIEVLRGIGRKSISKFTSAEIKKAEPWARRFYRELGTKSPFFRSWFGDWRAKDKSSVAVTVIPEYVASNEARRANRGEVTNADTDWNIRISREGETNTISHSGANRLSEYGLSGIKGLVENAILLDSEVHENHSVKVKNDLASFDHKFYALGNSGGNIGLYKITIEERYNDPHHTNEKSFHNLKYIEKVAEVSAGANVEQSHKSVSTMRSSTTDYSVSDLFELVKRYDKGFTYNFVNSSLLDYDGTPKKFYIADETADRIRLTADADRAVSGEAVYVRGEVETMKNGDIFVKSQNQIKSVSENTGTFDMGNPDIRYSLSPAETEKKKSDYTYEALISKPDMKVTAIDDGKTYSPTAETRNNLKEAAVESVKRVGKVNENGNAVVFIDDIGEEVIVPKRSITHGIDRRLKNIAPVLENIGEILKNAIRINELNTRSENITESYILIGAARSNNNFYIANFVVSKYTGEVQDINVLYSANAKKEEPAAFLPKITEKSVTPTGSTNSISQPIDFVNRNFKEKSENESYSANAKKEESAAFLPELSDKSVSLTDSTISISQLLDFVNRNFTEILPEDVLRHYGHAARPSGTFSKDIRYSLSPANNEKQYSNYKENNEIIDLIRLVETGKFKGNERTNLGKVSHGIAKLIYAVTGVNAEGFDIVLEARQVRHILKGHGVNGISDHSMANNSDIAKMGYAIENPDHITASGKTTAYTEYINGRQRSAKTVLLEKELGEKSYYVVEAVPDNKKRTVYILSSFIGKSGYEGNLKKTEASQTATAKSPDATSETETVNTSNTSISQNSDLSTAYGKKYSLSPAETKAKQGIRSALRGKLLDRVTSVERNASANLGRALGISYSAGKELFGGTFRSLTDEYLENGTISDETLEKAFDTTYEQAGEYAKAFSEKYSDIGKEIRETKFAVPVRDRESIENYSEILANSKDFTGLSEDGGKALKNFYGILNEKAPELFPRSLNSSPNKMLHKIYEVASAVSAAERTVNGLSEEGDNFKNLRKASFGASVNEFMSEMSKAKRYFDSKANEKSAEKQASEVSVSELGGIYKILKEKEKVLRRAERNSLLTADDSLIIGRLLRGETTLENIKNAENYAEIEAVYRAKAEYEEVNRQIKRYNAARRAKFSEEWGEILGNLGSWHDKKRGFLYARETLERNIDDIAPSRKIAKAMQEYAARPIHESEAKSTREKNAYRERVRKLGLSRKIARGNAVSESFAVQYIGEMRDNLRRIENSRGRLTQIDGMDYDGIKAELEKFRKNNPNLDMAKIENAVKEFEDIYGELYDRINETLMRNGYSPISKKSGYFPHFMTDTPTDIMERVCDLFGIKREVTPLPTSINGITDTFRPGKKFFPNLLERKSVVTEYDAVKGFDSYIEGAEDVINQTDNIARMRALSREIRYLTGDEGTKARIEAVEANETLTEEEKQDEILNIKTKGKFDLANFVSYIDEYTNLLAGKKSKADSGTEYMLGRFMYNIAKWGESRVAANMVALNPASWLTNFVPITQSWSCVGTYDMLRGMYATFKNHFVTDGVREASAFLTNRKGSERLVKARSEYISGKLSSPMEWIDNLTAGSVVRARLYYNMRAGLSFENALAEADDYAARVMADRSKGAMPTVFNQANPFTKLFTQFQLEVNNQFSFMFKDIPINKKDKKIRLVTWAMLKLCVGAWLYNQLYELFVGRRCAFDPIDIIWDAIDTGLNAEKGKFYKGTLKFFENTVDEMPFIGGLLGGGRLPINSALPDVGNVFRAVTDGSQNGRKRLNTIGKELIKPAAYLVPPFGGGQLKKLYEGYKAISEGGSYTVDKDGKDILQYPVYTDSTREKVSNIARVTLFGKSSLKGASKWVDKDFKNLSAKCTAAYRSMTEAGIKTHDAYDFLCELAKEQGKESIDRQIDIIKKSELATPAKTAAYFAFTSSKTDKDIMLKCEENGEDMGEVLDLLFDLRDSKLTHQKVADIIDADISDEAKENIFFEKVSDKEDENKPATIKNFKDNGLTFSDFLECYHEKLKLESEGYRGEEKAIMFKRFVAERYPNADVSKIVNDEFPTDAGIYEKFMAAGLDDETSYKLHSEIKALKPRNGKNDVSTLQKIEAVTKSGIGIDEQLDALSVLASASDYERFELAYSYGIKPADIATLKVRLENESVNQTAVKKEIDLLTGNGIVLASGAKKAILPEDKLHLTRKQKAVLWQLQNKSWKPDKNPYDVSVGREVYKLMQSDSKKSGKSTSDLPSTEKNYLPLPEKYK